MLLRQQKCVSPQRQHLRQLSRIDQQETLRIPDNIDDDDPLNLQPLTKAASIHISFQRMLSLQAQPTYLQVRHSGKWEQSEMDQYKVWEVVPRSPDMRVVGARWVYTRKIDGETGKPSAYKARWVAKGFSQIEGIDFNELFAATAHKDSIDHLDLECDQVDIKAAFLNGDLEETVYLAPEGSNISADKVLHLRKSLHGLKQSPRCFKKAFDEWLRGQVQLEPIPIPDDKAIRS